MSLRSQKSASSGQKISLLRKLDEGARQFANLLRNRNPFFPCKFDRYNQDLAEYRAVVREFGGSELERTRIFEIGCGQRPFRLFWLRAHGFNATAIDMDKVMFSIAPGEMIRSLQSNGLERTVKTSLRYLIFDMAENRKVRRKLSDIQGKRFEWPISAITQGDASDPANWPRKEIDFIYSEDVFEHIPAEALPRLCARMASGMSKRGIALIRPMVFTGIQGGHNVEYYNLEASHHRNCPPWDHLRTNCFPANTYLNQLTLADYRTLFSAHFRILDETVRDPGKGQNFMTESLREELFKWSDEELFSNHVRFILQPR